MHYLGAHVSAAKSIDTVFSNAGRINANALAFFVKSQRRWDSPPLSEEAAGAFALAAKETGFDKSKILVHGSYLMNLGSHDEDTRKKSVGVLIDELKRCERLGIGLYTFHPGSTCGKTDVSEAIGNIALGINAAHKQTKTIKVLIETMAGQGFTLGKSFEELSLIVSKIEAKDRIGICMDTCHMFSAGYDIRTAKGWEAVLKEFDAKIGLSYLMGVHLNDSKTELGSNKDRHENIGKGKIGIECFKFIMSDRRFADMPLILETPCSSDDDATYEREIQLLRSLKSQ